MIIDESIGKQIKNAVFVQLEKFIKVGYLKDFKDVPATSVVTEVSVDTSPLQMGGGNVTSSTKTVSNTNVYRYNESYIPAKDAFEALTGQDPEKIILDDHPKIIKETYNDNNGEWVHTLNRDNPESISETNYVYRELIRSTTKKYETELKTLETTEAKIAKDLENTLEGKIEKIINDKKANAEKTVDGIREELDALTKNKPTEPESKGLFGKMTSYFQRKEFDKKLKEYEKNVENVAGKLIQAVTDQNKIKEDEQTGVLREHAVTQIENEVNQARNNFNSKYSKFGIGPTTSTINIKDLAAKNLEGIKEFEKEFGATPSRERSSTNRMDAMKNVFDAFEKQKENGANLQSNQPDQATPMVTQQNRARQDSGTLSSSITEAPKKKEPAPGKPKDDETRPKFTG